MLQFSIFVCCNPSDSRLQTSQDKLRRQPLSLSWLLWELPVGEGWCMSPSNQNPSYWAQTHTLYCRPWSEMFARGCYTDFRSGINVGQTDSAKTPPRVRYRNFRGSWRNPFALATGKTTLHFTFKSIPQPWWEIPVCAAQTSFSLILSEASPKSLFTRFVRFPESSAQCRPSHRAATHLWKPCPWKFPKVHNDFWVVGSLVGAWAIVRDKARMT